MYIHHVSIALSAFVAMFANDLVFAVEKVIVKTKTPPAIIVVTKGGSAMSQFSLLSAEFPNQSSFKSKKLKGIAWRSTSYPQSFGETVELCYHRPYSIHPMSCTALTPNASGVLVKYNNERFGAGVKVIIRHRVVGGGPRVSYPQGSDSLTFTYSD